MASCFGVRVIRSLSVDARTCAASLTRTSILGGYGRNGGQWTGVRGGLSEVGFTGFKDPQDLMEWTRFIV